MAPPSYRERQELMDADDQELAAAREKGRCMVELLRIGVSNDDKLPADCLQKAKPQGTCGAFPLDLLDSARGPATIGHFCHHMPGLTPVIHRLCSAGRGTIPAGIQSIANI